MQILQQDVELAKSCHAKDIQSLHRLLLSVVKLRGYERDSESLLINVCFIWQVGSAEIFRDTEVHADK